MRYVVGVDIGGTNLVVGAMPADGSREIGVHTLPTRAALGADAVVDRICEMIETTVDVVLKETGASREQIAGVGIGSPGPLDREKGIVIFTPNLGWKDFPLRDRVSSAVKLPAVLDNDANCATLGEWWLGAAKGANNVVGFTLGTGIGGGLILNGQLVHGASDVAGEIGHMTIEANGRHCGCGNYGCLEAYASGPNIAMRAREALAGGEPSLIPGLVDGDLTKLTAAIVYKASAQGDAIATEVVKDTARFLGIGVANMLNVFNPDVVVLAGGVALAGDSLFVPLRAEVRRRAFKPAVDACRIVPGALDGSADNWFISPDNYDLNLNSGTSSYSVRVNVGVPDVYGNECAALRHHAAE